MERSPPIPSPAFSSSPRLFATAGDGLGEGSFRARSLRGLRALVRIVFSFEALFALFLYSNNIKYFLPRLPIDETVLFLAAGFPFAAWIVWRDGIRREAIPVLATAFLFFGWMTLSLLWTPARGMALRAVVYGLVFDLYCLAVGCLVLAGDRERLRRFFVWVVVVCVVLSVKGLQIYMEHGSFMFYEEFLDTPAYLNWTVPLLAGIAAASTLVFAPSANLGLRLLGTALIGVFVLFALAAGARASLLGAAVALAVPLFLVGPRAAKGALYVPKIQILAFLAVLAFAAYVVYLLLFGQITTTLGRFFSLLGYIETKGTSLRYERLSYWQQALTFWSWSPIIGNGINSFSILYSGVEIQGTHPHNIFMQTLADLGIVGFVLLCVFLATAIGRIDVRRLRQDHLFLAVVMVFVSHVLVMAMVHFELALIWELCLAIGLLTLAPERREARVAAPVGASPSPPAPPATAFATPRRRE
ncbi:MAG: O-antigen ligase family protein [Geminicoccaceae bacterium]|nr:O-antigen ligase family protein [Geminicoccaceae bacterium]MDW8341670.1 O-antigen ligase family protein [Geminicoccaceae bacterium]